VLVGKSNFQEHPRPPLRELLLELPELPRKLRLRLLLGILLLLLRKPLLLRWLHLWLLLHDLLLLLLLLRRRELGSEFGPH